MNSINPNSQDYLLSKVLTELDYIKRSIDSLKGHELRIRAVESLSERNKQEMTQIISDLHAIKVKVDAPPVSLTVKIAGWGAFCSLALSAITLLNILVI